MRTEGGTHTLALAAELAVGGGAPGGCAMSACCCLCRAFHRRRGRGGLQNAEGKRVAVRHPRLCCQRPTAARLPPLVDAGVWVHLVGDRADDRDRGHVHLNLGTGCGRRCCHRGRVIFMKRAEAVFEGWVPARSEALAWRAQAGPRGGWGPKGKGRPLQRCSGCECERHTPPRCCPRRQGATFLQPLNLKLASLAIGDQ